MITTALIVLAVAGAPVAAECEWPSVATFRVGETKCTATLVHPRAFVTAAHCLELSAPGSIRFGEEFSPYERRFEIQSCAVQTDYFQTRSPSDDYAICTLVDEVPGVPIVPIAMGCDTLALVPGAPAAIVGFGQPELGADFGAKHWARTVIADKSRPAGLIDVGDDTVNGCLGDSGGPGFVQLADGTWRAFGILTAGPDCGAGPSTFTLIHDRVQWLESNSGLDLTPCHDADGTYAPGEECRGFALDPLAGEATWEDGCESPRVDPVVSECAAEGEGDDAPEMDSGDATGDDGEAASGGGSGCAVPPRGPWTAAWMWVMVGRRRCKSRRRNEDLARPAGCRSAVPRAAP